MIYPIRIKMVADLVKVGLALLIAVANAQSAYADDATAYPVGDEDNLTSVYAPDLQKELSNAKENQSIVLKPGVHLFIDDYLIAKSTGITRRVNQPKRDPVIPNPIVTADGGDRCVGPYMTVVQDRENRRFRIWYNGFTDGSVGRYATMDSNDGIHWNRPARLLNDPGPIKWGCSILDEGSSFQDPSARYKLAWYAKPERKRDVSGGLMLATSSDGLEWKLTNRKPLVRHNHDINGLSYDAARGQYVYTFSCHLKNPAWEGTRRVALQCSSTDLAKWSKPWFVLMPAIGTDHSELQFYAMDGYLTRGDLRIGMVKILRDDLKAANVPEGAYGVGYTALAWTRDGKHWTRDAAPFFEPDPQAGAWDHAHAWIDEQLLVDDELRLYYAGYKNGHKMGRTTERQIGLVRVPRDRYVARVCGANGGMLRTVPLVIGSPSITANADVTGQFEARITDISGKAIAGFDYNDFNTIRGDSLDHALRWNADLKSLQETPVQIEFRMSDARLYGLTVGST
jgi:hypothetical protein